MADAQKAAQAKLKKDYPGMYSTKGWGHAPGAPGVANFAQATAAGVILASPRPSVTTNKTRSGTLIVNEDQAPLPNRENPVLYVARSLMEHPGWAALFAAIPFASGVVTAPVAVAAWLGALGLGATATATNSANAQANLWGVQAELALAELIEAAKGMFPTGAFKFDSILDGVGGLASVEGGKMRETIAYYLEWAIYIALGWAVLRTARIL